MTIGKKLIISLLATIFSLPIYAMTLNQAMSSLAQAKSQGLVGEQANGYLGVVQNQSNASEITKLINDARKQEYQKVAKQNNATLSDVEKLAGTKAQEKTPKGQYIQVNGSWQKK